MFAYHEPGPALKYPVNVFVNTLKTKYVASKMITCYYFAECFLGYSQPLAGYITDNFIASNQSNRN